MRSGQAKCESARAFAAAAAVARLSNAVSSCSSRFVEFAHVLIGKPVPTFPGHALFSDIPEFAGKREARSHVPRMNRSPTVEMPQLDLVRTERLRRTLKAVAVAHPFYRKRF